MDSKFDFKTCLSLLHDCTVALYTHPDDLSDEDLLLCDFLKYACIRYSEVYASEIRVMYRTSSIIKDSPNAIKSKDND